MNSKSTLFWRIFACLAFVATLLFLGNRWNPAKAQPVTKADLQQEDNRRCYSLDVVFLIDQSGSMAGEYSVPANDPTNQREFAPKAMVDLLTDVALDQCPEVYNRMAVISYGSEAQVDLPLSDIAPQTFTEAQALKERLKQPIRADNLGKTDHLKAYEAAVKLLDDAAAPPEGGPRKRVIIFITDGMPCVEKLGCNPPNSTMDFVNYARGMKNYLVDALPFSETLNKQDKCLSALRDQYGENEPPAADINKCYDDFRIEDADYQKSTYIFMLLMQSGQAYSQTLKQIYLEIADAHSGKVYDLSNNRQDIPSIFNKILSELSGAKVASLKCGQFAVNPYLKRANLVFYKFDPDLVVRLVYEDANGVQHQISGGQATNGGFNVAEYYKYGANERYTLDNPYPGIWQLQSENCDGLDAFYQEVKVNPGGYTLGLSPIAQFDEPPFYDEMNKTFLTYQMKDEAGNLILQADNNRFHVNIDAKVTGPDGSSTAYTMEWKPTENLFRATEPLTVPKDGTYKVDLIGSTYYHEGKPAPVNDDYVQVFAQTRQMFRHEGLEFQVLPVGKFQILPVIPHDNAALKPIHGTIKDGWPLPVRPIDVRVKIVNVDGSSFANMSDVLISPTSPLIATLTGPDGKSTEPIQLTQDPNNPGEFIGQFLNYAFEGKIKLTVNLESGYTDKFRPKNRTFEISFTRSDDAWNQAKTYYFLLAALVALLMIMIVYNILIRTSPVKGSLVFSDGERELAAYGLHTGVNWKTIGKKDLQNVPEAMLKKVHITRRKKVKGQPAVAESWDLGASSDDPGIHVTGETESGTPIDIELTPETPVTYSEATFVQMQYRPPESTNNS